jgi:uncharacterized protein YdhG (YjbR/CyaY superfamily)
MPEMAAGTVEAYIAGASPERREALELLRRLCREGLPGFAEDIRFRMPSYLRDGEVEVAFASHARYLSLYVLRTAAMKANAAALADRPVGKGCVRFKPDDIDETLVRSLLSATLTDTGPIC